jgi:hypothetical protein
MFFCIFTTLLTGLGAKAYQLVNGREQNHKVLKNEDKVTITLIQNRGTPSGLVNEVV